MSTDPGVWVAALLTFMVLSFLARENPAFRCAEHLFVGVSSGYFFVLAWKDVLRPNLVERLADESLPAAERAWLMVPFLLGLCMVARIVPALEKLSRLASAFIVGFVVGTNLPQQFKAKVLGQVSATVQVPETGAIGVLNHAVLVLGVGSVLLFFVFTQPRREGVRRAFAGIGTLGRWFLLVAFGASFGNTVMARIAILIGRVQFLVREWLGIAAG